MRRLLFGASLAVVVWAAVEVPMPYYETRAGSVRPVEDIVELSAATGEVNGDLALLSVRQVQPNLLEALLAAIDDERSLSPETERVPAGFDPEEYGRVQRTQFERAFTTAVAVAAREAGYEIATTSDVVVEAIVDDAPARGQLRTLDVITSVDGVAVDSADELIAELADHDGPDEVRLGVLRDDEELEVTVTLGVLEGTGRYGLGIAVSTSTDVVELPFEAEMGRTNLVGPSAGMMVALTALDLLLEEDLAAGRVVAGTGTIDGSGTVGPVGGVTQKVRGAQDAGAELILVPATQLDEARAAARGDVTIVGVTDLTEAVEALRATRDAVA